jgi:hypothetical protein
MLQNFIQYIFTESQMEKECLIIALLYIERVLFSASTSFNSSSFTFYLTSLNWRAFILSALLVASKMWDDFSMVNGDYVSILMNQKKVDNTDASVSSTLRPFSTPSIYLNVTRMNNLEAKFLALIGFNICVTGEDYARVYFRITVSERLL